MLARAGLRVGVYHHAYGEHFLDWPKRSAEVHHDKRPMAGLLVRDPTKAPAVSPFAERVIEPPIGKFIVIYADKPRSRSGPRPATA
jgi:hypothetical protein